MRQREMWKILGFVLIDFEEECLSLLTLFHPSKKYVFVTCNKILLNIIEKNNIEVQSMINVKIYGIKCAIRLFRMQTII